MKQLHKYIKIRGLLLFVLLALAYSSFAQKIFAIQGTIVEEDSSTVIPFAYAINLRTGNGCMSDYNGKYNISGTDADTIVFSYIGFVRKKVLISRIKNVNDSIKQNLKVVMVKAIITLAAFDATAFKIKPHEREYMERIIHRPRARNIEAFASPITALYEQYSRKGRENRKLAAIFEQIFIEEQVAHKFNPEILRQLTGDQNIDFEKFRKYCYSVSNDFIIAHEGYDLYEPIMQCYRRWKREGR